MSTRTRWLILACALAGFGFAAASSWVHYRLLTDPTYVSPCDVNASFNCTQAYLSQYGSVAGIPVALGGLVWFGLVALIAAFARPVPERSVAGAYLMALSTIGLASILYLGYASFFVLKTGCLLCIGTYVCVAAIFALSSRIASINMSELPTRLFADLRSLTARPVTLVAALVFLASSASVVAFFPREGEGPSPAAAAAAASESIPGDAQQAFADAWAKQPRVDMGIAAEGAKVIIVKFNDYECGACRMAETYYKPVLDKFAASHPGAVKYVIKDFPWDASCNFNSRSTIPGHEAACMAAAAARIAKEKGKFQEMSDWLYANQGTSQVALRQNAERILGISDFDRQVALKLPDIKRDIADGGVLNVNATPTYFINGVRLPSVIPPQYFELAISLELKRAVE
jgi:uncharacterized membrane protein/protein-disulfide isomerase